MLLSSAPQEEVKGGLAILRRRALINFNLNDLQCAVHGRTATTDSFLSSSSLRGSCNICKHSADNLRMHTN